MKKQIITLLLILCGTVMTANAQFLQLGLKLEYSTATIDQMIGDVQTEVSDFSTEFLQQCDLGLMFRLKFGRIVYLQPEANFSISSVWDSVDNADNFMDKIITSFDKLQQVNLSVPILLGFRLIQIEDFMALRIFAGPEFYTSIETATSGNFNFNDYSILAGVGIDLLNLLYVDARVTRFSDGNLFYRAGVGLIF
ncbi:MAG: hypothetical protein J5848_02615 [Bacteroidales bacterium]|nr:hypothetical protein [Bacteroidales bacterium]